MLGGITDNYGIPDNVRRFHLFEWEDQPWLPRPLRDFITDHLRYTLNEDMRRPINLAIARRLQALLESTHSRRIVDLCAGGGGPVPALARIFVEELRSPVEIVLTDLYPNVAAFRRLEAQAAGVVTGCYEPVDAFDVPNELDGVRTIFTALHHFSPDDARRVLADAVRKRSPIAIFEPLERTMRCVTIVGVMSLIRGFTHTPRIGSLTLERLLLTYAIPIAPMIFAWDGMVSALRSYTADELRDLARGIEQNDYGWESGRFEVLGPYGPMSTTYLIGAPK